MNGSSQNSSIALHLLGAAVCFLGAYFAFQSLALTLFQIGLSDFYNVASEVPDQCTGVVKDAVIAFTQIYDIAADALALVLLLSGVVLLARASYVYITSRRKNAV